MNKLRFAVISDIHGNYEALTKAMSIIKKRNVDKVICLGDVIGYGANPNECLEYVKNNIDMVLCGNHDFYHVRRPDNAGRLCRISMAWTKKTLNYEWTDYIKLLPMSYSWKEYGFFHTARENGEKWPYLNNLRDVLLSFSDNEKVCFYGHTHRPRMTITENNEVVKDEYPVKTKSFTIDLRKQRAFINPGSVGQQRDHKTDLSFAICEQNNNLLKVDIERHRYCAIKAYMKIKARGCGSDVADYLIREYSKKKLYGMIGEWFKIILLRAEKI